MEIYQYILSGLLAIIGYFLKDVYARYKQLEKEHWKLSDRTMRLEGKIDNLNEKMPSEIENLERIMDLKFEQFNKQFEELSRAIRHAEQTMKSNAQTFVQLLQEYKK
jgi:predicted nuclease with TOPRIM domain